MALNRSVGATGVTRKVGNPSTKATGIPSATKTLKSSDHSFESSQKVIASQLADGKATSGTSPKPRSGVREKGPIPGRTVPSIGGTGVNNNAKVNIKSTTPSPLPTHGIGGGNGPGRLPTKVVAKDRSGRSSPKLNGLPDVGAVVMTELHSKSEAMLRSIRAATPPQSAANTSLRVDKSGTKPNGPVAQTTQMKVGLPVASFNKRLSVGSLGAKPGAPSGVTKGRSPPLSSAVNSETSAKAESPKVRKTTGIAKLQHHPSSAARSVTGTTTRPRGLPGPAPVGNVRASTSVRTIPGTDLNANANTGGRDTGTVRKDVRTKTGQPSEKLDNTVGLDRRSILLNHKNLGLALDKHKLSVARNLCTNITENQIAKVPVHASQDFISNTFEEAVEDVSECEYFSETRSTVSENLSDFADGGLNLDLNDCFNHLGPVNLSDLREDAEGNFTSLGTSMDDIFASCEDIAGLGEDTVEDRSSKTSDHTEQSCMSELVEESLPVQSSDASLSHVGLTINDRDLQVIESDSTQHDLQIIEDGDDALKLCIDSSVICERSLAADIPETSFDGITVGSNVAAFEQIDSELMRATSGKFLQDKSFQDKSEAILNNSSYQRSSKEASRNETLSQYALLGCVDECEAEGEDENQSLQGGEKTTSESLSKCAYSQNDGDEDLRDVATPDVDQELTIIEEEPGDLDLGVDDTAVVDAELEVEDMTTSADAQKPEEEDASISEVTTEDASVLGTIQEMRVEDSNVSADGQELRNDMETEGKCSSCSSNGFGADGVIDCDGDGSSGPPRAGTVLGTASTPTEASAAAAEVDQVKVCSATHKDDDDDSISSFLGDSCETLKCEYESDVDPDLMKDMDGGSAAGSCCCTNQVCGCSVVIQTSGCTDKNSIHINDEVINKKISGACSGDRNEINVSTQIKINEKSRCMGERIINSSSSSSFVKESKKGCMSESSVVEDEILRGEGSGQSGKEKCQDVGMSGGLLSFRNDITLQKSNYCDQDECVVSDTKCALKGKDNNTSNQDGKDCKGTDICLPGAPGQLSSSFINEFSAWLGTETVTGSKSSSFDPGVSQSKRNAEAHFSSASQLNGSSLIAMDTVDVKVILTDGVGGFKFVDEDVEEVDNGDGQSGGETPCIRLVCSLSFKSFSKSFSREY